ncbi:MAG TPA: hypothetical protein VG871_14515 [Vicinamibacterales bacterium]|nr:hypothetical protein [Vicinamibacterales bacterium]
MTAARLEFDARTRDAVEQSEHLLDLVAEDLRLTHDLIARSREQMVECRTAIVRIRVAADQHWQSGGL